jgi:phytoene synthase
LTAWEQRLNAIWKGEPVDLFDLAMADTVRTYPSLSIKPFKDMILGMIMDVPGVGQERYETFDELYLYCYRVAGTVGLMTLPVLGTADGCDWTPLLPLPLSPQPLNQFPFLVIQVHGGGGRRARGGSRHRPAADEHPAGRG